jgi:amidophosphoribosyltransferase
MTAARRTFRFDQAPADPESEWLSEWYDDDRPREECGVFGVFGSEDASVLTALGLHALQHRGQEGCGIVSFDGRFHHERHLGLVGEHFSGADVPKRLPGSAAIGHTRYPTQGGAVLRNVQPLFADLAHGGFAVGHNGNLTNAIALRRQLVEDGAIFQSTSDSECIIQLVARSRAAKFVDRFIDALRQLEGAYALVGLTETMMLGARDPFGIRPLMLGDRNGAPILASETCALDMIGASFVRAVEPGEVVVVRRGSRTGRTKIESYFPSPRQNARPCLFEFVYFSRPDSVVDGRSVYDIRKRMGARLAQETGVKADVVVPVPDSGVPAAMGFAAESGLPYELGIIRNHYVGRTFIQPKQEIRALKVRLKHSANAAVLKGKRVILVDDSIVRGTTSQQIVQMVREAGATEVHFRSASPPIKFPDFYGIDLPRIDELMAAQLTEDEMRKQLGVDTLGFLSVEGLYWAMGEDKRNPHFPQFTDHCFTGEYPTGLTDRDSRRGDEGDAQLSFLADPDDE